MYAAVKQDANLCRSVIGAFKSANCTNAPEWGFFMLEKVYSAQLPVGEDLVIYRNRIACERPVGRIAIVSGIHLSLIHI